ncbi:MAG: translation initiation factor [Candidatus Helarchaeota archaeon]|nr:translation initiation factor [Candidatus Helarchaeota archaeon]
MDNICPKCSLPKELCICEQISKEETVIKVKIQKRRYGRKVTVIEGLDANEINLPELLTKLKSANACGGTLKRSNLELQGDHRRQVRKLLIKWGFPGDNIVIQ